MLLFDLLVSWLFLKFLKEDIFDWDPFGFIFIIIISGFVFNLNSMNNRELQSKGKKDKSQQLFEQFLGHCATIIQSNFKAYQQRKRYRQFLPIYRRLRELLFAGFQGWKTRRILKLQHIKSQIASIHVFDKSKNCSKQRIGKR